MFRCWGGRHRRRITGRALVPAAWWARSPHVGCAGNSAPSGPRTSGITLQHGVTGSSPSIRAEKCRTAGPPNVWRSAAPRRRQQRLYGWIQLACTNVLLSTLVAYPQVGVRCVRNAAQATRSEVDSALVTPDLFTLVDQ